MVQAMINISPEANQVLNIIKARYNLKDKSQAIDYVVLQCGTDILEPELRPEYVEKIKRIEKQKSIHFKTIDELRESIEHA